ncbi:MAG TPA: TIGR03118 family protein, partial [Steroidobacteraceae bacterium]|nr:TIGR03118 family protein [Steroidobacteraceae bacterium]
MYQLMRQFGATAMIAMAATSMAIAGDDDSRRERDAYVVTALTSNLAGHAAVRDPVLQNAWGIAFSPAGSPFWINDNATGCATLYDGTGAKVTALQVSIPLPGNVVPVASCQPRDPNKPPNPSPAAPTGIVWNPSASFLVPGTKIPAVFIFATEDGTLSAWAGGLNPADSAVLAADESSSGAVYKGLAFALNAKGAFLFATNFNGGRVDVFGPNGTDGMFTRVTLDGDFSDTELPAGYAPFNIVNIDG